MKSFLELYRLNDAALSWQGTPFCERSAVRGAGVCCHRLVIEVLIEAGWLPRIEVPDGSVRWAAANTRSLIVEWFDGPGAQYFDRMQSLDWSAVEPGDIVGFRLGRTLHHLALALPNGRWTHAAEGVGAVIVTEIPPAWRKRAERLWRIKE
jgi:hypothetical protein